MKAKILVLVAFLLVVSVAGATGVAAQEVEREIQFEDEVVEGNETTITYVATVVETPVNTDVDVELTLLVDGEEVQTVTSEEEVFAGAELRTEFTHTFDSPGEKNVTVKSVTQVLGQELTDTTTATVTVTAAEEEDETEDGTGDGMEDDTDDDGTVDDTADDSMEDDDMENETDGDTEMDDNTTDGTGDDTEEGGEGLPGFGVFVAIASLAVVAVYAGRRKEG